MLEQHLNNNFLHRNRYPLPLVKMWPEVRRGKEGVLLYATADSHWAVIWAKSTRIFEFCLFAVSFRPFSSSFFSLSIIQLNSVCLVHASGGKFQILFYSSLHKMNDSLHEVNWFVNSRSLWCIWSDFCLISFFQPLILNVFIQSWQWNVTTLYLQNTFDKSCYAS